MQALYSRPPAAARLPQRPRCTPIVCTSSSQWYEGPSTSSTGGNRARPSSGRDGRGRADGGDGPGQRSSSSSSSRPSASKAPKRSPPTQLGRASSSSRFAVLHSRLKEGQEQGFVINKEAWQKLFSTISRRADAEASMALMLEDARVRDGSNWDWVTHGYGQSITQLVKAAGAVRAYDVCEWALENASTLRLTVGQGTIPDFMRKLAAVQADVEQMERLYRLEESVRGKNTHAGFYELLRVYKRVGSVAKVQALLQEAAAKQVPVKEGVLEDTQAWLEKRGAT